MISCPKCSATLPDGSGRCQFCGASFTAAPVRPGSDPDAPTESVNLKWVWPAYYAIAGWWIFNGLYGLIEVLLSKHAGSFWGVLDIAISVITALVGLGLILRVELARGVVNVLCFLQILQGLFGILGGFIISFAIGIFGAIAMVMSILQIIIAVLMVFVIGETESRAANI